MSLIEVFFTKNKVLLSSKLYKFSDFNFNKYSRLFSQFRTPRKEDGAVRLCNSVFPEIKDKNIEEEIPKHIVVTEENEKEVEIYCREKRVNRRYIDENIISQCIRNVYEKFCGQSKYYSVNSYEECLARLPKNTSSCFPNYIKKGNLKNIKYTISMMKIFDSHLRIDKKLLFLQSFPCTVFNRFTPKLKKKSANLNKFNLSYKIRQIFGVSHFIVGLEVKYLTYFMDNFKRNMDGLTTIGKTRVEVSKLVSNLRSNGVKMNKLVMCGDISGCDKSIPSHFYRLIFGIFTEIAPNEYIKNALISLGSYMCYTPILRRNEVKYSNGSTLSGSLITSIFTTFVIYFVLTYVFLVLYKRFPSYGDILVQGDDFIMLMDEGDERLIKEIFMFFNLRIKVSKGLIVKPTEGIEFLGFIWDVNNEPNQSNEWIYSRIVYPEKSVEISGPDRIICRYLSLLFQLSRYLDLFKKFVEYDDFLRRSLQISSNPKFYILDNTGNISTMMFPIVKLLHLGWKMF